MNFLWCEVCSNGILIGNKILFSLIAVLFAIVFSIALAKFLITKIKEKKKIKYSFIYTLILSIVFFYLIYIFIIPLYGWIAEIISDDYFSVDPIYKITWGETTPSYDELVNFNYNYVKTCLLVFSIFSYVYFKILNLIKMKKIFKYVLGGFYILILLLSTFVFFNYHDYLYNRIEDAYVCSNACSS